MASKEEKDPKKSWFDLDSFIAGYGLRWVKSVLKRKMGEWKQMAVKHQDEGKLEEMDKLYYQLADLFQHGETADREIVEAAARVAVEVVDGLLDKVPFVPVKAKNLADDLGGDTITEIRDHFANTEVKIPDNLEKIKGPEMAKQAAEKVTRQFKMFFTAGLDWPKQILDQLSKVHAGFSLQSKLHGFLATLFTTPDPEVLQNFFRFANSELMKLEQGADGVYYLVPDDEAQKDFADMAENWDTFPEFVSWFSKPLAEQREAFSKARMLKHHTGLPRLHRDTTEAIQAGGKAVAGLLHLLNEKLRDKPKPKRTWSLKWSNLANTDTVILIAGAVIMAVFLLVSVFCYYTKHDQVGAIFLISALSIPCALIYFNAVRRDHSNG